MQKRVGVAAARRGMRWLALFCGGAAACAAAPRPAAPTVVGRWDITVRERGSSYPSWLDIQASGRQTLVGYFVGRSGSVRPISRIQHWGGRITFIVPPQWERGRDLRFDGRLSGGMLRGTTTTSEGRRLPWSAVRAPSLKRPRPPEWGTPVELFNGRDLAGWVRRDPKAPSGWVVQYGLLRNRRPGNDLLTAPKFMDFRLQTEFRYPKGSNSGIYLRGRYEAQIEDDSGRDPESHLSAGIYGFLAPRMNASRPPGEWQTCDITLIGRRVTVVFNGETVLDRQEIPGITGGALDSREGQPGPILLQGDHGPIDFRKITLTPAR